MKIHPVGRGTVSMCKLDSPHLTDKDGTKINEALNCRSSCVSRLVEGVVGAVSATCSKALDVKDVFYAHPELFAVSIMKDDEIA
jgi:hypothetical protein